MKKFGFLFALIAVLAIAGSAFASWDVKLSADVNGTKGFAKSVSVTLVSGDAKKGTWTLHSNDLEWWLISNDDKASADFTRVADSKEDVEDLDDPLYWENVIYVTSKDNAVSNDFGALGGMFAEGDSAGFYALGPIVLEDEKPVNIVVTPSHYKTFSLIFKPEITDTITEWEGASFDHDGEAVAVAFNQIRTSADLAITYTFTLTAPPVEPKKLEKEEVKKILENPEVKGKFDENGAADKADAKAKINKMLDELTTNQEVLEIKTFPMFKAPVEAGAPGVTLKIASAELFPTATVVDWKWFTVSADYAKVIPSGDIVRLDPVETPSAEGEYSIDDNFFYIYVGDASGDFTTAGKMFDFDPALGKVVDPFVAVETKEKGSKKTTSGGCSAAYAPFALLLAAPLFFLRKKD